LCKYTFAQRRNRRTTHFSERISVVKRRISVVVRSAEQVCYATSLGRDAIYSNVKDLLAEQHRPQVIYERAEHTSVMLYTATNGQVFLWGPGKAQSV
jgi:hypothetical protein